MSIDKKRHHRERLKKNRRHHFGRDLSNEPTILAKVVNTPAPCSCWGCGNQRRIDGLTRQEMRADNA